MSIGQPDDAAALRRLLPAAELRATVQLLGCNCRHLVKLLVPLAVAVSESSSAAVASTSMSPTDAWKNRWQRAWGQANNNNNSNSNNNNNNNKQATLQREAVVQFQMQVRRLHNVGG